MIGQRLAHHILQKLGSGEMGGVYLVDTKLGREVAIKVLPEAFSQDSDRLARFESLLADEPVAGLAPGEDLEAFSLMGLKGGAEPILGIGLVGGDLAEQIVGQGETVLNLIFGSEGDMTSTFAGVPPIRLHSIAR